MGLRKSLNLYAAVRPVRSLPGVVTRYDGVDLIVVRENTEGLYSGVENEITNGVVASMKVATRTACHRIALWAFRFATHMRRKKITVLHKANIMKMTDGMFIEESQKVHAQDYPNIEYNELIVDAGGSRSFSPERSRSRARRSTSPRLREGCCGRSVEEEKGPFLIKRYGVRPLHCSGILHQPREGRWLHSIGSAYV